MKNKILYQGDEHEALWATLGYLGPFFIVSMNINKKSPFICVNGIRSAIMFILTLITNVPVLLLKFNILYLPNFISVLITIFAFIISTLLFIDYCYATYQTANGFYKKTFFIDKFFWKIIYDYMNKTFFRN